MNRRNQRILFWLIAAVVLITAVLLIVFKSGNGDQEGTDDSPISADDWTKGNADSEVVLLEYSDLQCPACKGREPILEELMGEFGSHIKLVYRHFPLRMAHPNSQMASQAAEAAGVQGKFWEMHGLLFEHQEEWSPLEGEAALESFKAFAQQLGLDMSKFEADLESDEVKDAIEEDFQAGLDAGVNSTPTFFLNGKLLTNTVSYEALRNAVRQELEATPAS